MTEHTRLRAGRVHLEPGLVRVRDGASRLDPSLEEDQRTAFEVVTPRRRGWTWTRKQAVRATGTAVAGGRELPGSGHVRPRPLRRHLRRRQRAGRHR